MTGTDKARVLEALIKKRNRVHPKNRHPELPMGIKLSFGDLDALIAALTRAPSDGRGEADGRVPAEPGSREPSPAVSALTGFDASRVERGLICLRDSQSVVVEGVRTSVAFDALCDVLIGGRDALAELARAKEIIERVRDIDYWEGNGEWLIDWVTLGYTEDGRGHKTFNTRWTPLRDSGIAETQPQTQPPPIKGSV